jgi:hypothetical protein
LVKTCSQLAIQAKISSSHLLYQNSHQKKKPKSIAKFSQTRNLAGKEFGCETRLDKNLFFRFISIYGYLPDEFKPKGREDSLKIAVQENCGQSFTRSCPPLNKTRNKIKTLFHSMILQFSSRMQPAAGSPAGRKSSRHLHKSEDILFVSK